MSALPDRAPPELEPGVTLDDLLTVEDCDATLDRFTLSIASIEDQLARKPSGNEPVDWRPRAKMALRIKKLLLPRLQQRRAGLIRRSKEDRHVATSAAARVARSTKDRAILSVAREIAPEIMARALQTAIERHPELFNDGGLS